MSQIRSDRITNNRRLRFVPTQPGPQPMDFLPQRRRIGRLSLQQTREGIVRRGRLAGGCTAGGLGTGEGALGSDEELDVVQRIASRRIHPGALLATRCDGLERQHGATEGLGATA
jgi:hypothetical protein